MEKLKHATGWGRCLTQIGLAPGWRDNVFGMDADCETMCELGWMRKNNSYASEGVRYHVTDSGLALVLAEWAKVQKFDVVTLIEDDETGGLRKHTTRVVAKTHGAARFKIAQSIQEAWCCDFGEAFKQIKSVRKVRP